MAQNQHLKDFAKKLVSMSLDSEGQASADHVRAVLDTLAQNPPRAHKQLLKLYAKFLELEINRGRAHVEYCGAIRHEALDALGEHFTAQYGRKIVADAEENHRLIAGVRVTVGDDVYDSSLATRLAQLEHNIA